MTFKLEVFRFQALYIPDSYDLSHNIIVNAVMLYEQRTTPSQPVAVQNSLFQKKNVSQRRYECAIENKTPLGRIVQVHMLIGAKVDGTVEGFNKISEHCSGVNP